MKAVILSGGFGTRMRPLTYTTPKPLLPLLNKPLIMHVIDSLPEEVEEVILAANYKIDMLREFFDQAEMEKEVKVVDEPEPRGTGGAVKNVEEYLDDTFFVINSDIVSSIDLKEYLDFFRAREGVGSISAWRVDDPSEFGIMETDEDGRIKRFQEKPDPEEAFSDLVNAGHYILESEVLDRIPPEQKVSMEDEIFPKLLDDGLYVYRFKGYWIDCGRPSSLFRAHRTLLDVQGKKHLVGEKSLVDTELGDYVTVGEDCTLEDCEVSNSIIFDGVEIAPGSVVKNSILGYDVIVEENVTVEDSIISDELYLESGRKVTGEKLKPEEGYDD
ncbi:MAG: sugar phosphate nucleotidyltransferase [Candidatus Natronoplasma sp.]